jgi:hypothetical protein
MTYRFLGTEAEIAGRAIQRLGQEVELPEDVARDLVVGAGAETGWAGAIALLPAEQFDAIGFTPAELQKYAYPGPRQNATAEFRAKWQAAMVAVHEYRVELETEVA